jgi:hypothetical protein
MEKKLPFHHIIDELKMQVRKFEALPDNPLEYLHRLIYRGVLKPDPEYLNGWLYDGDIVIGYDREAKEYFWVPDSGILDHLIGEWYGLNEAQLADLVRNEDWELAYDMYGYMERGIFIPELAIPIE